MRSSAIVDLHVAVIESGNILLMRRQNTGYQDNMYGLPSGHLERGETLKNCAIRELKEEIGISVAPENLELVHLLHHRSESDRVAVFFQVCKWEGEITNAEEYKCSELLWTEASQLPNDTIAYVRSALNAIQENSLYGEFGWDA